MSELIYPELAAAFGEAVRKGRNKIGLSQSQLADDCAVSRVTISNIENGNAGVSFHLAVNLIRRFKIDLLAILKEVPEDEKLVESRKKSAIKCARELEQRAKRLREAHG